MSRSIPATTAAALETPARLGAAALYETTKPRITRLVTITSGVGFVLAALARPWTALELALAAAGCVLGTALSAAGANALNQWWEQDRDGRMPRTRRRPLPEGRLTPASVFWTGVALGVLGVALLWALCGPVPAAVSAATILSYLLVYTPLKPVTPLATIVGAVPGALPPLIGWTAGSGAPGWASLAEPVGWALFLILFVWQVPHFLAIAWLYRDDYAQGGYKVLPVVDSGERTSAAILAWSVLLVPVTLAPSLMAGPGPGPVYGWIALLSGIAYLYFASRLAISRSRRDARTTFIASVIHLPILMVALVADPLAAALL